MLNYTLSDLARIMNGHLTGDGCLPVQQLLIDSRALFSPDGALFFALRGQRHDGHLYIGDLYASGVRAFVVEEIPAEPFPDASFVVVGNTLAALQQVAAQHRRFFAIPVVAVTGSNGKTVVKEWLYQAMQRLRKVVRSPRSYNSQVGVPLSVWQLSDAYDLAIFEAGISYPGEMARLETILRPDVGILTHIGEAHQEHFASMEEKIAEKLKLFIHCKTLIYNAGDARITREIEKMDALRGLNIHAWKAYESAADMAADARPAAVSVIRQASRDHTLAEVHTPREVFDIRLPFADQASFEDAMHVVAFMLFSGYDAQTVTAAMQSLAPVAMRLEMKQGIHGCTLINDSYNSDTESLAIALDVLGRQTQHALRTLILSDILQTGRDEDELYREVAQLVTEGRIDRMIGIGPALCRHQALFAGNSRFFLSTADFLQAFRQFPFNGEAILLKGARPYAFERIADLLEGKSHETVLEVDLSAMINNYNYFKSLLRPETKMVVMAKACTYGSGTYETANLLQYHRVDYLAVAFVDEGVVLRENGITVPLMVMNPELPSLRTMVMHRLEPEMYSLPMLRALAEVVAAEGLRGYPVHIKLDTGMHRLGFQPADLPELIAFLRQCPYLKVQSAFSHLAGSDEARFDDFTRSQIARFKTMTEELATGIGYRFLRHILNSAGIERFPEAQFDMVRLGIGLHGISAAGATSLKPVVTLKSTLLQIKEIASGESVGYSRRFMAGRPTRYGVVPIGYADGWRRALGNGRGYVTVRGQRAPIIGNICMDMCTVDLTGLVAEEGDTVVLMGEHPSVTEIADMLQTIPYEVLTDIAPRVKRVYYQE